MKNKIFNFSNTYVKLPENFYQRVDPIPVINPELIEFNSELSNFLNIDSTKINNKNGKLFFSGNIIPEGAMPIAIAYAGHQFGNFVPQLGDGRAVLIGEIIARNKERYDIQLKGSGKTIYSRDGDGRSPLGPAIREYLISESIHKLGIKSTRSLALVRTGEKVFRETVMPGGILTRVASSHIRIGTFEFFYYKRDFNSLKILADYTLKRHFNTFKNKNSYIFLLRNVINSQAELVSKWMSVGFIHGVMNTDNTTISGETIDYGPCAFLDHYDPKKVFSYIDFGGRYSYMNQGKIMLWNLSKFAESIIPLLDENLEKAKKIAIECLNEFPKKFEKSWLKEMRRKFGLTRIFSEDINIIDDFLKLMRIENLDFTLSFRNLSDLICETEKKNNFKLKNTKIIDEWILKWNKRLEKEKLGKSQIASEMKKKSIHYIFLEII